MEMSCDCSRSDFEGPELVTAIVRRARVMHVCCECRQTIEPGQKYEYVRGLWDGSWSTHKTCISCKAIRDHYCCRGYIYGELSEVIRECLDVELI